MEIKADIEAIFEFTEFRKGKTFEGYRPAHLVKEGCLTTGVHNYYKSDVFNDKILGTITFISPEEYPNCLWKGKRIAMFEGSKLIGYATVTKILNPILMTQGDSSSLLT